MHVFFVHQKTTPKEYHWTLVGITIHILRMLRTYPHYFYRWTAQPHPTRLFANRTFDPIPYLRYVYVFGVRSTSQVWRSSCRQVPWTRKLKKENKKMFYVEWEICLTKEESPIRQALDCWIFGAMVNGVMRVKCGVSKYTALPQLTVHIKFSICLIVFDMLDDKLCLFYL